MIARVGLKLGATAALLALAGVSSANATVLSTTTQTQNYGPQAPFWQQTFAFQPFSSPAPHAVFEGIQVSITGTQITNGGQVYCMSGVRGSGTGTTSCVGSYTQGSTFKIVPTLSTALPDNLPANPAFTAMNLSQSGTFNLMESNFFTLAPTLSNMLLPASTTTTQNYSYYNSLVASGGTLDQAYIDELTGASDVKLTFSAANASATTLPHGGLAPLRYTDIIDELTVSITYFYTTAPEPSALAIFAIGGLGLVAARRQRRGASAAG